MTCLLRLFLSVGASVFFTQPINFDCVFSSASEHGFSFGYPPLAICVCPFLNVILENHSGISIVYCRTVAYLHFYRICVILKMTTIMLTENLPPAATAGGPPNATGSTILHVLPAEAAVFDQEFLDNYNLDVEGGDEYTGVGTTPAPRSVKRYPARYRAVRSVVGLLAAVAYSSLYVRGGGVGRAAMTGGSTCGTGGMSATCGANATCGTGWAMVSSLPCARPNAERTVRYSWFHPSSASPTIS